MVLKFVATSLIVMSGTVLISSCGNHSTPEDNRRLLTDISRINNPHSGVDLQKNLVTVPEISCSITVDNKKQLEKSTGWTMKAGTTVCLEDGTYKSVELALGGKGSRSRPITVAAKNPGKVFIEGDSQVRMMGDYVVLHGIVFRNGNSSSSDLIQTRGKGNAPCNNCRITEIKVTNWDREFEDSNRWLLIYGQGNRIDHSWFEGKENRGALLTVDRSTDDPDRTVIDHNYFGDRPPADGKKYPSSSDNEYEAIRIGTSGTHRQPSYTRVEYNYFEKIRGEAEIISNKSSFNTISHNTIRGSYGSIVLRHGSNAVVSHNYIFGDNYPYSGGIRITDANHQIFNNYVEGCSFANSNFNGGLVFTNSDGNNDSGYQQVENIYVAHNTIVDCVSSINFSGGKSKAKKPPKSITMINNIFAKARGPIFLDKNKTLPKGSNFMGNFAFGPIVTEGKQRVLPGFNYVDPMLRRRNDLLYRPDSRSPVVAAGVKTPKGFPAIVIDMDGQQRPELADSGADQVDDSRATLRPLTARDVGPVNYTVTASRSEP